MDVRKLVLPIVLEIHINDQAIKHRDGRHKEFLLFKDMVILRRYCTLFPF